MCHTKECNDLNDHSFKEVCICEDLPKMQSFESAFEKAFNLAKERKN